MQLNRRQFSLMCASTLALPGWRLPKSEVEPELISLFPKVEKKRTTYAELCYAARENFPAHHSFGYPLAYSDLYKVYVPYEYGFCVDKNRWMRIKKGLYYEPNEESQLSWAWGEMVLRRNIQYKRHIFDGIYVLGVSKMDPIPEYMPEIFIYERTGLGRHILYSEGKKHEWNFPKAV